MQYLKGFLLLSLYLFIQNTALCQWGQVELKGQIVDASSGETLPNASLQIVGTLNGTVANSNGSFTLTVPSDTHRVSVSYLGYEDQMVRPADSKRGELVIKLKPWKFELTEILVRPQSPEEYIKLAVKAYPDNFSSKFFQSRAYFSEKAAISSPQGKFFKENRAVITSQYPNYIDTSLEAISRMDLLTQDSSGTLTTILSQNKRLKEVMEEDESSVENEDNPEIQSKNGMATIDLPVNQGPKVVLSVARGIIFQPFFQEKHFKRIKFSFGEPSFYKNRELIAINFKTKRKIDYSHYEGRIFLDVESLAVVSVDFKESVKLPFYINAIIRPFLGFTIRNISFNMKLNHQELDNVWYPKEVIGQAQFQFKQKGVVEQWVIRQLFSVSDIVPTVESSIKTEHIFSSDKDIKGQVYNVENLSWDDVNVVE